jgi:hypothetical protein
MQIATNLQPRAVVIDLLIQELGNHSQIMNGLTIAVNRKKIPIVPRKGFSK